MIVFQRAGRPPVGFDHNDGGAGTVEIEVEESKLSEPIVDIEQMQLTEEMKATMAPGLDDITMPGKQNMDLLPVEHWQEKLARLEVQVMNLKAHVALP